MNKFRVAFIKAGWHKAIVNNALVGFEQELAEQGVENTLKGYDVPGAFEMPLLAKRLAETGKFDAIVCAALVVDGGIYLIPDLPALVIIRTLSQIKRYGVKVHAMPRCLNAQ